MPTRRSFLGLAGVGALAAASGTPLFASTAGQGRATPPSDKWDLSWVDRLKGRHKAVFDSPEISGGAGLYRAMVWADQVKEVYGAAPSDVSAVLVIRHQALPLAMDDEFWSRFKMGQRTKMKNAATRRWYTTNPIRTSPAGSPPPFSGYNTEAFVANGGTFLVCGLAFQMAVARIAAADKVPHDEADKRARAHLLPGAILQPSGVFAALTAQEAGCSYIMAS